MTTEDITAEPDEPTRKAMKLAHERHISYRSAFLSGAIWMSVVPQATTDGEISEEALKRAEQIHPMPRSSRDLRVIRLPGAADDDPEFRWNPFAWCSVDVWSNAAQGSFEMLVGVVWSPYDVMNGSRNWAEIEALVDLKRSPYVDADPGTGVDFDTMLESEVVGEIAQRERGGWDAGYIHGVILRKGERIIVETRDHNHLSSPPAVLFRKTSIGFDIALDQFTNAGDAHPVALSAEIRPATDAEQFEAVRRAAESLNGAAAGLVDCPDCMGRGWRLEIDGKCAAITCNHCGGTGRVLPDSRKIGEHPVAELRAQLDSRATPEVDYSNVRTADDVLHILRSRKLEYVDLETDIDHRGRQSCALIYKPNKQIFTAPEWRETLEMFDNYLLGLTRMQTHTGADSTK